MRSVLSQSHNEFTLFVIDNASKDETLLQLEQYRDLRVRIVANQNNLGVAEGNNQGIRLAQGLDCEFVLLINNDTEFDSGLFETMLSAAERCDAEMLVPKIMYFEPRNLIWCAGGYFKPWLGYMTGHFGEGQKDSGQFNVPRRIKYAPTCCMLIRSSVFLRVGLMDARYFVYVDDTDFCWRAQKHNIRFWYDPQGLLYHKVSSLTGGNESDFTLQYGMRNKVYYALKNFGPLRATCCLFVYLLISLLKALLGRDSGRVFLMKLRWYFKGIKLYLSTE